ncbi:MAG: TonB family protein [Pyrinomonadaceae bacterium]|nr:TonB family protein [Pyrinomonadaceae bacterium]
MMKPRTSVKYLLGIVCALAAIFCSGLSASALAQEHNIGGSPPSELTSAIELYKKGDDKGAIEALRRVTKKQDKEIAAWYYMALAYTRQGKQNDARKAYEKAAKSGEWLIDAIYASMPYLEVPAKTGQYKGLLLIAAESAKKYLELSSKPSRSKREEWSERAELLNDYAMLSEGEKNAGDPDLAKVYTTRQIDTKARIISRPEPQYTDEARKNQVMGTVVLRGIFAFDGKVRAIRVMKGLPDGLTMSAIRAARRIKFVPATINGKPVSQYIQIEYNFNLY